MTDDRMNAAGPPEDWEPAELEPRRQTGVAISVRMPAQLFRRIERHATEHSMSVSGVIRNAADEYLGRPARPPVITLVATAYATLYVASSYTSLGGRTR